MTTPSVEVPVEQQPPADELHDIRVTIKALEARERELKNLMFTDPSARTGNQYVAVIKSVKQNRTDWSELKKMHPDLVAEFTWEITQERVELRGITEDGELVSVRRKEK